MKKGFIGERSIGNRPTSTSIVSRSNDVRHSPKERYTIDEALDIFIQSKEAEGLRPRSIENYREHTKYLVRYVNRSPLYIDELTPSLIREYILFLTKERVPYEELGKRARSTKGLSPYTVNLRLRS